MNLKTLFPELGLPESISEALIKGREENVDNLLETNVWRACVEAGIQKEDKPLAILNFDTDKIKEYVFASPKLPEIRGGSELIGEALNDKAIGFILEQFGLKKECIIYASGGGGMLILPSAKANAVGEAIEQSFVQKTLGATVTCACIHIHPMELLYGYKCLFFDFSKAKALSGDSSDILGYFNCMKDNELTLEKWLERKCFGELVAVLSTRLQKKKGERKCYPFIETIPYAKRCISCGIRAVTAVPKKHVSHQGEVNLCEVCREKKDRGLSSRREGNDADDLKTIGEASRGRANGYVGAVYADGNGMGKVLQELKSLVDYRKWSRGVDETFNGVVDKLITEFGVENTCERLVLGGDDIILFLPADKTLAFTLELVKSIRTGLRKIASDLDLQNLRDKMGLSAGIVIAHHNYPALYLVEYAEQLLKTAKKHGKRDSGNPQSAIDFAVLTDASPLSTEISDLRKALYIRKEDIGKLRQRELNLISRPFTLDAFSRFLEKAQALKAYVPRSQIYLVREFVQNHSKDVAEINFMYQLARCRPGESWRRWIEKTTEAKPWNLLPDLRELIWKENQKDKFVTSFADYTEVYHFI